MKTRLLIIFLCFWSIWSVYAQQYPVDCRISVLPPYSTRFYDYASSVQRFKVSLLLRDFSKSNLDVVLQIRLKGPGFVIENPSDYFSSDAYNLIPGRTLTLSGMDLSSNFNPSNLETYGVELSEMFSGVGLPPGPYEWEVRAFERFRDRQVSNTAVFRMNLSLNYPPLLRQPANGSVLSVQTPQNLRFSWMPRASASPSQGTLYTLFLYEVPEGDDAEAVVNSGSAPYRMIETTQSFYQYGGGEIPLEVGKRYAWQVQVSDIYGASSYVNNGYSEVFSFIYGKNSCSVPSNVVSKVASDGAVELSWEAVSDAQSYILRYRVAGESKYESITTDTPNYLLLYQAAGKKYEYQVSATCQQSGSSAFTPWREFEIADLDEAEAADSTAYISDPGLSYEAEVYEPDSSQLTPPKPEDPSLDDLLNSPIKLYVGGEDGESPLSLPTNPSSLSTEELKAALKTKKPTCAGITASYTCGNHDVVPQYSGSIVSVNTGDEIAMNSLIMSVVSIDASGNGSGKIKIPMFNNAEVGVTLLGIKVAEGGCIVEGRAELSGVDLALLNEQQRAKLDQAYSLFLEATDAVYANAGAIAETINTLTELYEKIAQKTKIILDKVNGGKKISKSEQKALVAMKQKAKEGIDKQVAYFTKKFGSEGSDEIIKLVNLASQSCTCEAYTETSEPNKGPYADAGEWIFYDDDCKKCLEEDKQKQEELAKLAKAFEEKLKAIKDKKMECGCGWNSIKLIWQSMGDNGNCEEIIAVMNKFKADLQSSGSADVSLQYLPFDANKPIGQVSVGDICIDNFSIEMQPHDASGVEVFSTKKDQYKDSAVEISGNRITFNDYQAPTDKSLSIKTDNNEQAKLIEKWLFEGAKGEEEVKNNSDTLDDETYKKYAKLAGIEDFIAFKAFTIVESGGNGFFDVNGKKVPKLLFERHLMYKCLRDGKIWGAVASNDPRKDKSIVLKELLENRPEIVAKTGFEWCKKCTSTNNYVVKGEDCQTSSHNEDWFYNNCYIPTIENYEKRFLEAVKIHKECAYMATSWGLGQVIGANFRNEFSSIEEMEKELMTGNNASQLFIMASFIKNNNTLKNAINNEEWVTAASEYNGPNYSKNNYDEKLKKEYQKLKKGYEKPKK